MLPHSTDEITTADLQALIDGRATENLTLEFKQNRPDPWTKINNDKVADKKRAEFLKDIAAMANARGGYVVYGLAESEGGSGVATGLPGFQWDDADGQIRELLTLCRRALEPPVSPRFEPLPVENGRTALVVQIPDSWKKPHMVTFQHSTDFFARKHSNNKRMSISEIGDLFVGRDRFQADFEEFRSERLKKIASGKAPIPLTSDDALSILHIVPMEAARRDLMIDMRAEHWVDTPGSGGTTGRHNAAGYLRYTSSTDGSAWDYVQHFRDGSVESCSPIGNPEDMLPTAKIARETLETAIRAREYFRKFDLPSAQIVYPSLIGVEGFTAPQNRLPLGRCDTEIRCETLALPESQIRDGPLNEESCRRLVDPIWQCVGRSGVSDDEWSKIWESIKRQFPGEA